MKLRVRFKGGPGSGFHGHAGRPGHVGGSAAGSGAGSLGDSVEFVDKLAYTGDVSVRGIDSNGNDVWVKAGYDFNNGVINNQQLSYETAKILGFDDIVPESKTIPATGSIPDQDADIYILTRHVPGKTMGKFLRDGDDASKIDVESARKLVVLDAITGNIDRNLGNYIISDSGKVFAIDNDSWTSMDPRDHFSTNAWLKFQTAGVEFDYPIADIKHAASTLYNSEKFRSLVNFSDTQTLGEMHIVRRLDFILSDAYETAYKEWLEHKGGPGSGHFGHSGIPGQQGGSLPGSGSSNILPPEERVWQGKQQSGKLKLNQNERGRLGEELASNAMQDKFGVEFSLVNEGLNNAPIDVAGDHRAIEVKTGIATNGYTAQHWRITTSYTSGPTERDLIASMTKQEKKDYNRYKQTQSLLRKRQAVEEMSRIAGSPVKGATVGVILSPDGTKGDIFYIPGFHLRLRWDEYATEEYYIGTYNAQ